jgi:hypothetical protein
MAQNDPVVVKLEPSLKKKYKKLCVDEGVSMGRPIREFIVSYVRSHRKDGSMVE